MPCGSQNMFYLVSHIKKIISWWLKFLSPRMCPKLKIWNSKHIRYQCLFFSGSSLYIQEPKQFRCQWFTLGCNTTGALERISEPDRTPLSITNVLYFPGAVIERLVMRFQAEFTPMIFCSISCLPCYRCLGFAPWLCCPFFFQLIFSVIKFRIICSFHLVFAWTDSRLSNSGIFGVYLNGLAKLPKLFAVLYLLNPIKHAACNNFGITLNRGGNKKIRNWWELPEEMFVWMSSDCVLHHETEICFK